MAGIGPYLRLVRLPNVFTAWADVWAGALLARAAFGGAGPCRAHRMDVFDFLAQVHPAQKIDPRQDPFGIFSIAMMALMVVGIVIAFIGFQRIMSPNLPPMVPPRHYNEYSVVCERCETELPPDAQECPKCGNKIEW
jgi:ribosomal protein L40E